MTKRYNDVLIVGGGPAGLAAALALSAKGKDCLVVDFRSPPLDKACGEGLMPDSRRALAKLGVNLNTEHGTEFSGIRFCRGRLSVEGSFPEGMGLGVRRTTLHNVLLNEAQKRPNINFLWNTKADLRTPGIVRLQDSVHTYQWLIGADGLNSRVRTWSGLDQGEKVSVRTGFRQHFRARPWTDKVEVHWSDHGELYITPVQADEIGVVFLGREKHASMDQALLHFPEVATRLRYAPLCSKALGAQTATRTLRRVATESIALVGDASGSVDAITGEGLSLSFRQAIFLADSVAGGNLTQYAQEHKAAAVLPSSMAQLMLLLDHYPQLQTRALLAMGANNQTFNNLLAAHVGHRSLALTLLTEVPQLGWNMLCPPGQANRLRLSDTARLAEEYSTPDMTPQEVSSLGHN